MEYKDKPCSCTHRDQSRVPLPTTPAMHCDCQPQSCVLVLRKHSDQRLVSPFCSTISWLAQDKNMTVYVEAADWSDTELDAIQEFKDMKERVKIFMDETKDADDVTACIDLVICLGGDWTVVHAASLFQGRVPPIMAFTLKTSGFLTPLQYGPDFRQFVSYVLEGSPQVFLRYRLECSLYGVSQSGFKQERHRGRCDKTQHLVLNQVVLNRCPSSTLSTLEIYIGDRHVTSLQGDGLIVSTPTGSTCQAVSAGSSLVHPSVPCVIMTPICPHSLSFRPVVVPAGVTVKVKLCGEYPDTTCMLCFDGTDRHEMRHGQILKIRTAAHPVQSIIPSEESSNSWFQCLTDSLHWNVRRTQAPLDSKGHYSNNGIIPTDFQQKPLAMNGERSHQQNVQFNKTNNIQSIHSELSTSSNVVTSQQKPIINREQLEHKTSNPIENDSLHTENDYAPLTKTKTTQITADLQKDSGTNTSGLTPLRKSLTIKGGHCNSTAILPNEFPTTATTTISLETKGDLIPPNITKPRTEFSIDTPSRGLGTINNRSYHVTTDTKQSKPATKTTPIINNAKDILIPTQSERSCSISAHRCKPLQHKSENFSDNEINNNNDEDKYSHLQTHNQTNGHDEIGCDDTLFTAFA